MRRSALRLLPLLIMLCFAVPAIAQPTAPFCIGETIRLHSELLREDRVVNIYLPPAYSATDTTRYNVIYLLDGSAGVQPVRDDLLRRAPSAASR